MGRRSVNTTKSGKFMNPTDQARKIARRRELKKNKKQRNTVRMAVLKSKDPRHLLDEMEQIDLMEFNPRQAPQLNERVLKEKRRKLKETFDRVYQMYEREDPELAVDLKKAQVDYEKMRAKRQLYYEQVKNAERVNLDMIPLPEAPGFQATASSIPPPKDIPLPLTKHGILKRTIGPQMLPISKLTPPGHPPGPPPPLSDVEDDDEDDAVGGDDNDAKDRSNEDTVESSTDKKTEEPEALQQTPTAKKRKIRFADDADDDDEEGEEEKDTRSKFKSPVAKNKTKDEDEIVDDADDDDDDGGMVEGGDGGVKRLPPPGPPPMMYRLPPLMLPPGMLPPGPPPRMRPPPGLPPPRMIPPRMVPPPGLPPGHQGGILSAPPTFNKANLSEPSKPPPSTQTSASQSSSATISAKPKIRSLIGDATRFTPLSVKVRREVRDARGNIIKPSSATRVEPAPKKKEAQKTSDQRDPGTDNAYDSFMKEMQGFL